MAPSCVVKAVTLLAPFTGVGSGIDPQGGISLSSTPPIEVPTGRGFRACDAAWF